MRKGVCQDFAHIMLGCLRSLGLPAPLCQRLPAHPAAAGPAAPGRQRRLARLGVGVPAGRRMRPASGLDLDPTNDRAPGEDYVTLATGRDYSDVSPLRGVIHGGARHKLHVAVTVTPVAVTLQFPAALSNKGIS